MSRGWCPYCDDMVVRKVRQTNFVFEDKATYRRNTCPKCGENFLSIEKPYDGEANKAQWTAHWSLDEGTEEG